MPRIRRPKTITIGPIKARPIRGPHKDDPKRWYWRAMVWEGRGKNGETVWTGWCTRSDAMTALTKVMTELSPTETSRPMLRAEQIITVRDLLEHWMAAIHDRARAGSLSPRTATSYQVCARRLAGAMGDVALTRLDLGTLGKYRDERLKAGSAHATIDLDIRALRVAWKWAQDRGIGPTKVLPRFRVKGPHARSKHTPTQADVLAVIEQLDGWPLIAVRLLAATGARIGEVAVLRWESVDIEREQVTLNGKTGLRVIPLAPEIVDMLTTWREQNGTSADYLLGVAPKTTRTAVGTTHLSGACKAACVPRFTAHGLRRYAVDTLLRAGIDVGTAAAMLGHSPEVMLRSYRKATMGDMRDALRKTSLGQTPQGKVVAFPKQ